MKKVKALLSILLVVCMVLSISPAVFAQALSWIYTPTNVTGFIYFSSPNGFCIRGKNYDEPHTFVTPQGIAISADEGYYFYMSDTKLLRFNTKGSKDIGVMDINKNILVQPGIYDNIIIWGDQHLIVTKSDEQELIHEKALIDIYGNVIVPFGTYSSYYSYNSNTQRIVVYKNGAGVIDFQGNVIIPVGTYEDISLTERADRYHVRTKDNQSQIVDETGNIYFSLGDHPYSWTNVGNYVSCITFLPDGTSESKLYDLDGNLINDSGGHENLVTFTTEDEKVGLKNINGDILIEPGIYSNIKLLSSEKYVLVYDENKYVSYSDLYGNLKIPFEEKLEEIEIIDDKYVLKTHENYSGKSLTDINGKVLVPYEEGNDIAVNTSVGMVAVSGADGVIRFANITNTNSISVLVNDNEINFDQSPILENGRTLVPIRAIFEALGAEVKWDDVTKTATSTLPGVATVKITIDSNVMYVNDSPVTLDVPAKIINSRTLVPVRAISEAFNCNVDWNQDTQTVIITK